MCLSKFLIVITWSLPVRKVESVNAPVTPQSGESTAVGIGSAKVPRSLKIREPEQVKAWSQFKKRVRAAHIVTAPEPAGPSDRKGRKTFTEVQKVQLNEIEKQKNVVESLLVWIDLFHVFGFDWLSPKSQDLSYHFGQAVRLAENADDKVGWIAYFKYKIAAFFAYHQRKTPAGEQVLPPAPDCVVGHPGCLFGGPFYRFTTKITNSSWLVSEFLQSILNSKCGMPLPGPEVVKASVIKNYKTMTSEKAQTLPKIPERVETWTQRWMRGFPYQEQRGYFTVDSMKYELRRTVQELFKEFKPSLKDYTKYILPSASANYNRSRTELGSYGEIDQSPEWKSFQSACILASAGNPMDPFGEDKNQLDLPLHFAMKEIELRNRTKDGYDKKADDSWRLSLFDDDRQVVIGTEINDKTIRPHWLRFFWNMFRSALNEEPLVEIVGLAEALKVRCISKGPVYTYFVLKPLQRLLWAHLQKFWNFELTGGPITVEKVNRRFGRVCPGAYRFHSGDYKAATDELHSWVSECLAHAIMDQWDENVGYSHQHFRTLLLRSLTGHKYLNPENPEEIQPQSRGQLMGSITSFPFLCLANITLIRVAYEHAHKETCSIQRLPAWINGDDCLTRYSPDSDFPIYWRNAGEVMGFQESVGKTYDSERMASINSRFFMLQDNGMWKMINYVNVRIVKGQKRSTSVGGSDDSNSPLANAGARHREALHCAGDILCRPVNQYFLYQQKSILDKFTGPWFLPTWAGGLGLVDIESKVDTFDLIRLSAAKALIARGEGIPSLPGAPKDWEHFNLFRKVVRTSNPLTTGYYYKNFNGESTYGQAFVITCLVTWATFGLQSLFSGKLNKQGKKMEEKWDSTPIESIRFNNKVNRLIQRETFRPSNPTDLVVENLITVEPVILAD